MNLNSNSNYMSKTYKQPRSKKTRQKLLEALEVLLKRKDFDQISVAEIAGTAGVSNGILYAHFKNKAEFLDALLAEYYARLLDRVRAAESADTAEIYRRADSLREALRWIAKSAYEQTQNDAHLITALSYHLRTQPPKVKRKWQALRTRASLTIQSVLDVYPLADKHQDKLAREMLVYFFNSIYSAAMRTDQVELEKRNPEAFTREIGDMAYGYLRLRLDQEPIE